jgi:hypothetical protein
MRKPVFLSASEPDPNRQPEYWHSRRLLNVREAIRAFCAHVLPRYPVVFGGHPAITPLVRNVAERIRHAAAGDAKGSLPQLLTFQSEFFVEGHSSGGVVITPACEADGAAAAPGGGMRNASLLRMRYEMLGHPAGGEIHPLLSRYSAQVGRGRNERLKTYDFEAAVFIGGMEGVQREFVIFRSFHPHTPVYPIASTGSACLELLKEIRTQLDPKTVDALSEEQPAYSLLMHRLFPMPSGVRTAAPEWHSERPSPRPGPQTHIDPPDLDRPRRAPG